MKLFLDQLAARYQDPKYLASDPLEFVHRYQDPWDREAVSILAALLAYGNVVQVRKSVQEALDRMSGQGRSPAEFIRPLASDTQAKARAFRAFQGYVHRFNPGRDIVLLLVMISRSWNEHGSVGAHFARSLEPGTSDISSGLNGLISDWSSWAGGYRRSSFAYFLTAPRTGGCCKRWCMLLKWLIRSDGLDLGLWSQPGPLLAGVPPERLPGPHQLVMPLDTHVARISQYLGLTRRKSINWKAAIEVTEALRSCDPQDPTRYDFALSRLGILKVCKKAFRKEICLSCDLLPVCQYAQGKGVAS